MLTAQGRGGETAPRRVPAPSTLRINAADEKRANDNDGGDRVGDRHQRRVQRRSDRPNDVIANENGENEDGQIEDEGRSTGLRQDGRHRLRR